MNRILFAIIFSFFLSLTILGFWGCGEESQEKPDGYDPITDFYTEDARNIEFARQVFFGLIQGDDSIENDIDWELLSFLDLPLSAEYLKLTTKEAKSAFRHKFILAFARAFLVSGADLKYFVNWRIYQLSSSYVVVAVNYTPDSQIILLYLTTRNKTLKLASIQALDADGQRITTLE